MGGEVSSPTFTENLHVRNIVTDSEQHGIAIGAYSGQSDTPPVMSWLFLVNGDGSRVLDLASQGTAKLIPNPGDGAPGLVMGDSSTNQAVNSRITNLSYATDNLDACPRGQTVGLIQDAVDELVEYIGYEIDLLLEHGDFKEMETKTVTLKNESSTASILAFSMSNIRTFTRPPGSNTNYDILVHNSVSPITDDNWTLGHYNLRYRSVSSKTVDTAGIFTDVTRTVNDRKGLVIGGYVGSNDVDLDPSWIFRPQQANPEVLDFVSLKSTTLQASAITCSSLTISGNQVATRAYAEEQLTAAKAYTDTKVGGGTSRA